MRFSRLCFGGAAISGEGGGYGFGAISENDAVRLLHAALDLGINIFDAAPIYGFGLCEQRMGKAFNDRRDRVYLVSKCGITWDARKRVRRDNSPGNCRAMLEQTLRDFQSDWVDLYLVHWPDRNVPIEETLEALRSFQKEGKIRDFGLCNFTRDELGLIPALDGIRMLQNELNLLERRTEELFPLVRERGLGLMTWGALDKGILTGRVTASRRFEKPDARAWAPWWKNVDRSWKFAAAARIAELAGQERHSALEMALGYVLRSPEVTTAICGVRNEEQLLSAVRALDHLPSPALIGRAIKLAEPN